MAAIKFLNMHDAMQKMTRSLESIKKAQKTAAIQMGQTCKQAMQDNCAVKTGHWQKSVSYQVEQISDLKTRLTIGSDGAERYYYIQEATRHPLEIGLHQATPKMDDIYQHVITQGLLGRTVTQSVSRSNIDEFASMAGF